MNSRDEVVAISRFYRRAERWQRGFTPHARLPPGRRGDDSSSNGVSRLVMREQFDRQVACLRIANSSSEVALRSLNERAPRLGLRGCT